MVSCRSVCLRRLSEGRRRGIIGFGRFLANERVTLDELLTAWGTPTASACVGRHVLAIQDTSNIDIRTQPEHRRGLGKAGKGGGYGLLLHPMLAVDADTGGVLGLVGGRIWTREPGEKSDRHRRPVSRKEGVTQIGDRESDFYALWARLPGERFEVLTRARDDRTIPAEEGGRLSKAQLTAAGERLIELPARPGRSARTARLQAGYGKVTLTHPTNTVD